MPTNKKPITADQICAEFYFQYFRVVKDKFIKRDGVQYQKAKKDAKMWLSFEKCAATINEYHIDYVDYISNTFNHYKKYIHPKTLINIGNLTRYKKNLEEKESAKATTHIYEQIVKSIRFVAIHCKMNDVDSVSGFFKYCIQNDSLGIYLMSGKVSKYYLAMFNNLEEVAKMMKSDSYNEIKRVVLDHQGQLDQNARNAIMTFTGSKKVSIIGITNHNINKVIGE